MPNENLANSYYFTLNLGGAEAAGWFKECSGLTSEHTVVCLLYTSDAADE